MKKKYNKIKLISIVVLIIIIFTSLVIRFKFEEQINFNKDFYTVCKGLDNNINSDTDIEKFKQILNEENRYSEIYTLSGIQEYKENNIEASKEMLNKAIEVKTIKTDYMSLFFSHKYLFEIYKLENNYENAKLNLTEAIKSIPKKKYNTYYKDIGELIKITFDQEVYRNLAIEIANELIEDDKYINSTAELYLRARLRSIYILSNRYAEATNSLLESIEKAKKIDDNYILADSIISLAIIFQELGGEKTALTMIDNALSIEIEDKYKDALVKTYGHLNLAYIQFFHLKDYNEAINNLENIDKYREYFTEEDFRDIEIYKLIYEANSYIMKGNLDLAKEILSKAGLLLKEDKKEYYINKTLEYYLAYGRYFYAKDNYDRALTIYKYILEESKLADDKQMQKIVLNEIIHLTKEMNEYEDNFQYVIELMNLNKEREDVRYYNYSIYIANSISEKKQIEDNYDNYMSAIKIIYISTIVISLIYIYINKKIKKLKYLSEYDGLTNIYNRKKFDTDYTRLLKKENEFACMIMDIDNFKKINDTYGHGFGDIVIKNSSKKIQNLLPKNYNLYRYGGEEFVILAKYKNKDEIIKISEYVRKSIEGMVWKEQITVTLSIGVAFFDKESKNVLECADKKLYEAKNNGKNKVIY